jgi:hypothetical protein
VQPEHLIDFLDDLLFILNTDEESNAAVTYMANELCALINELSEGNVGRLVGFKQIYNQLKNQKVNFHVNQ